MPITGSLRIRNSSWVWNSHCCRCWLFGIDLAQINNNLFMCAISPAIRNGKQCEAKLVYGDKIGWTNTYNLHIYALAATRKAQQLLLLLFFVWGSINKQTSVIVSRSLWLHLLWFCLIFIYLASILFATAGLADCQLINFLSKICNIPSYQPYINIYIFFLRNFTNPAQHFL